MNTLKRPHRITLLSGLAAALVALSALPAVHGQDADYVVLSSFASKSASDSEYVDTTTPPPNVAITLHKQASTVVMDVTFSNSSDKTDEKNRDILASIKILQRAAESVPPLRLERREIQLRGDKRRVIIGKSAITSYAHVELVAPLQAGASVFDLVDKMRSAIGATSPVGSTRIADGEVYLKLDNPEQYRRELLKAIFDDVDFLKARLGDGFEVLPSGLDGAIQTRASGETEVELWLNYHFTVRSLAELANTKAK